MRVIVGWVGGGGGGGGTSSGRLVCISVRVREHVTSLHFLSAALPKATKKLLKASDTSSLRPHELVAEGLIH